MSTNVFEPLSHDLQEGFLVTNGQRSRLHIPKRRTKSVALCGSPTRALAFEKGFTKFIYISHIGSSSTFRLYFIKHFSAHWNYYKVHIA